MINKQHALVILEELFNRSGCLSIEERGHDSIKWRSDFEAAVRHLFPGQKAHIRRIRDILTPPTVFAAGQGYNPSDLAGKARKRMQQMLDVQAVLTSMMDEIRNFWGDSGASPNERARELGQAPTASDRRNVFVVHGRDNVARQGMFDFLRAIKLNPLEWSEIVKATGKASPYVGEVLEKGFEMAQAVVVLLTPDDEARLKDQFKKPDDPAYEAMLTGQARPNVLFEAGMALGLHPDRTVLVELGRLRPISDLSGRHMVRMKNSRESRQELADRLTTAKCAVDLKGQDWLTAGDFRLPEVTTSKVKTAGPRSRKKKAVGELHFENGVYWGTANRNREGPFCQACWDTNKRMSRLQDGDNYGGGHEWFCTVCGYGFGDKGTAMVGCD